MSTLFVSDIHLNIQAPVITGSFLHFLRTRATAAQALYILGDLFEVWIGDDDTNPLNYEIANALQALGQKGIPCYFIHGNRDFLLGHRYAIISDMKLLSAPQVICVHGVRVVILHGDTLCADDKNYQRLHRIFHQDWLKKLFLALPLRLRKQISKKIRANSRLANAKKTASVMDVNAQSVMSVMAHTDAMVMIHGHTHQPAIHVLPGGRLRAVLGAWYHQGVAIEVTGEYVSLHEFPLQF
ncbi:UDP-2,3-diacylglucosamine diphosphatase [secondary endosymbiont of Ctenarytaina eucalypti]|uniref:UDP-2,3-diacylglucosamine hydrolase n=1 Tax=secondary endosymbiont of Ctenarytaina eucalypti TaxID=1199245 RepID=J3YS69_9ENTR|nr:UDP-2,3-diacylglucosamine diphosphatase [secondary endosymbiont of Ctenarytaina eucalypti]AFP85013.1 UDP-2,3-diacylglucosamine hydrolase [secondary endosymbiont of Ctenarytaina eucalypti]